jgi:hypothetical protein
MRACIYAGQPSVLLAGQHHTQALSGFWAHTLPERKRKQAQQTGDVLNLYDACMLIALCTRTTAGCMLICSATAADS